VVLHLSASHDPGVDSTSHPVRAAAVAACAAMLLGDLRLRLRAPRPAALALVAVVAVPSLIELGWHGIYTALYRAPDQIKFHHEYWRLLTGSIVQDGGLEGTILLATTMAGLAAVRLRVMPVLAAAAVIVVAGAVLLADNDAHGIPVLAGLVTGAGLTLVSPVRDAAGR
jgi:hypothetical protein